MGIDIFSRCYDYDSSFESFNETGKTVSSMEEFASGSTKYINIDFTSFAGVKSEYSTTYGPSFQQVRGVIAPEDWPLVQEYTRDIILVVDEENAHK